MEEIIINNIVLRKPVLEDAFLAHKNFFSSEKTAKYMYWTPSKTVEDTKVRIERWINTYKENMLYFIIENNEPIGFLTSVKFNENSYGDIGLCLGENYVNKGYGTKVLNWLISYLTSQGAKHIYYTCMKENVSSNKLAQKLCFKYYKEEEKVNKKNKEKYIEVTYVLNI